MAVAYHNEPQIKKSLASEIVIGLRVELTGETWEIASRGLLVYGARLVLCRPCISATTLCDLLRRYEVEGKSIVGVERHAKLGVTEGETLGLAVIK